MGELGVEQKELEDPLGGEVGGVDLAVGLKGGGGAEQAHPVEVLVRLGEIVGEIVVVKEIGVEGLEQHGGGGGALDEAADLDELPAFAVAHGGVGDALELVDGFHDLLEELGRFGLGKEGLGVHVGVHFGAGDLEVERIEAGPHFGGDLLADVAGVFAGADEAGEDGGLVGGVEGEGAGEVVGIAGPLDVLGLAEGEEDALPAAVGGGGAFVEHEVEVDVEDAGWCARPARDSGTSSRGCRRRGIAWLARFLAGASMTLWDGGQGGTASWSFDASHLFGILGGV